jgi:hypothetical protein
MRAFWDVAPCGLGVERRFRGAYCFYNQGKVIHHPDDEGSTHGDMIRRPLIGAVPLKRRYFPRLHGAVHQKALIFILAAVET